MGDLGVPEKNKITNVGNKKKPAMLVFFLNGSSTTQEKPFALPLYKDQRSRPQPLFALLPILRRSVH